MVQQKDRVIFHTLMGNASNSAYWFWFIYIGDISDGLNKSNEDLKIYKNISWIISYSGFQSSKGKKRNPYKVT